MSSLSSETGIRRKVARRPQRTRRRAEARRRSLELHRSPGVQAGVVSETCGGGDDGGGNGGGGRIRDGRGRSEKESSGVDGRGIVDCADGGRESTRSGHLKLPGIRHGLVGRHATANVCRDGQLVPFFFRGGADDVDAAHVCPIHGPLHAVRAVGGDGVGVPSSCGSIHAATAASTGARTQFGPRTGGPRHEPSSGASARAR